jgi:hypothetical protein
MMNGALLVAIRIPICVADAPSRIAAVNGNASNVTCPANEEIRTEVHSRL